MTIPIRAFAGLLLASYGCGSDPGGSSSTQGKKLSDLSLEERMQLCASNIDDTEAIEAGNCTLAGLGAPAKADCEVARDECKAASSPATTASCQDPNAVEDFSDCTTIRVGQVESCLREASTFLAALSCEAVGQEPTLPSCIRTLEQGCPVLIYGLMQTQ
jgi:hypothetical protein